MNDPNFFGDTGSTKCGRCGRPLSDPESKARGLGPVCAAKVGGGNAPDYLRGGGVYIDTPITEGLILDRAEDSDRVATNVPHRVTMHSPSGYEFGYGGSGPADLALNTVEHLIQHLAAKNEIEAPTRYKSADDTPQIDTGRVSEAALSMYQQFKSDFIARARRDGDTVPYEPMREWVTTRIEESSHVQIDTAE